MGDGWSFALTPHAQSSLKCLVSERHVIKKKRFLVDAHTGQKITLTPSTQSLLKGMVGRRLMIHTMKVDVCTHRQRDNDLPVPTGFDTKSKFSPNGNLVQTCPHCTLSGGKNIFVCPVWLPLPLLTCDARVQCNTLLQTK